MAGLFKLIGSVANTVCASAEAVEAVVTKASPAIVNSAANAAALLELNTLQSVDQKITELGGINNIRIMQQAISELHK